MTRTLENVIDLIVEDPALIAYIKKVVRRRMRNDWSERVIDACIDDVLEELAIVDLVKESVEGGRESRPSSLRRTAAAPLFSEAEPVITTLMRRKKKDEKKTNPPLSIDPVSQIGGSLPLQSCSEEEVIQGYSTNKCETMSEASTEPGNLYSAALHSPGKLVNQEGELLLNESVSFDEGKVTEDKEEDKGGWRGGTGTGNEKGSLGRQEELQRVLSKARAMKAAKAMLSASADDHVLLDDIADEEEEEEEEDECSSLVLGSQSVYSSSEADIPLHIVGISGSIEIKEDEGGVKEGGMGSVSSEEYSSENNDFSSESDSSFQITHSHKPLPIVSSPSRYDYTYEEEDEEEKEDGGVEVAKRGAAAKRKVHFPVNAVSETFLMRPKYEQDEISDLFYSNDETILFSTEYENEYRKADGLNMSWYDYKFSRTEEEEKEDGAAEEEVTVLPWGEVLERGDGSGDEEAGSVNSEATWDANTGHEGGIVF